MARRRVVHRQWFATWQDEALRDGHLTCSAATLLQLEPVRRLDGHLSSSRRLGHAPERGGPNALRAVCLLAGHFSGEVAKAYFARGIIVVSCDYRACEWGGGLHYRGDVRDILFAQEWRLIVASMPCKDIAQCDTTRRREKLGDGRAWFGMLLCLSLIHI